MSKLFIPVLLTYEYDTISGLLHDGQHVGMVCLHLVPQRSKGTPSMQYVDYVNLRPDVILEIKTQV